VVDLDLFVEEETLLWVKYRMMMYINATQQHVQSFIWMKLRLRTLSVPGIFRLVKNVSHHKKVDIFMKGFT
jgi:hypothetical protein